MRIMSPTANLDASATATEFTPMVTSCVAATVAPYPPMKVMVLPRRGQMGIENRLALTRALNVEVAAINDNALRDIERAGIELHRRHVGPRCSTDLFSCVELIAVET